MPDGWFSDGLNGGRPADDLAMDRLPQSEQSNGWAPEGWVAEPPEEWVEQDVPGRDVPVQDVSVQDLPGQDLRGQDLRGPDLPEDDQAGHDLPTGSLPALDGSPERGEPEPAAADDDAAEGWVMDDRYPVDRRDEERGDDMSPAEGRDPAPPSDADPGQDAVADAGPAVPEPIQILLDEYTARRHAAEDVAATAESIAAAAAERAAAAIAAAARAAEEAEAAADAAGRASAAAQAAAAAEQRAIAAAGGAGRARRAPQARDGGGEAHPHPDARASRSVPAETRPATVRAAAPRFANADPMEQEPAATPEQPGGVEAAGPPGPAAGPGAGRRGPEPAGPPPGNSRPVLPAGPPPEVLRGWLPQEAATAVFAAVPGGRAARRRAADGGRNGAVDADATEVLTGLESLRSQAGSGQPEPRAAEVTAVTAVPSADRGEPDDPWPQDLADDDREPGEDAASDEPAPRPRRADREEPGGLAARLTTRPALATLAVVVVLAVAAVVTALTTSGAEPAPAPAAVVDAASLPSAAAALPPPEVQAAADVDPESDKAVEFLTAMRDADIPTSRSGQAETEAAAVVCEQLDRGSDEDTLVRALPAVLPDVTRAQAGNVVNLAQKHYC